MEAEEGGISSFLAPVLRRMVLDISEVCHMCFGTNHVVHNSVKFSLL